MKITSNEMQDIMQDFWRTNKQLPNTILVPAGEKIEGYTTIQIESYFRMKVIYAAISRATVAIL